MGVSLYQLVATPERFDGKRVRVKGYLHLEFEGNALYPHREDFELALYKNGVWIDLESCGPRSAGPLNDTNVLVEATFSSQDRGHLDLWSGALSEVSRCEGWGRRGRQ